MPEETSAASPDAVPEEPPTPQPPAPEPPAPQPPAAPRPRHRRRIALVAATGITEDDDAADWVADVQRYVDAYAGTAGA